MASVPREMPPQPMTGISTSRATSWTQRTARGLRAGPDSQPYPSGSTDLRPPRLDVDGEARPERIDRHDRVSAGRLGLLGGAAHLAAQRAQLHETGTSTAAFAARMAAIIGAASSPM